MKPSAKRKPGFVPGSKGGSDTVAEKGPGSTRDSAPGFAEGLKALHTPHTGGSEPDGTCVFQSVEFLVYGGEYLYGDVRQAACGWMLANKAYCQPFFVTMGVKTHPSALHTRARPYLPSRH